MRIADICTWVALRRPSTWASSNFFGPTASSEEGALDYTFPLYRAVCQQARRLAASAPYRLLEELVDLNS